MLIYKGGCTQDLQILKPQAELVAYKSVELTELAVFEGLVEIVPLGAQNSHVGS